MALNRNNERMREVEVFRHEPPARFEYFGPPTLAEAHDNFCWDMHLDRRGRPMMADIVGCVLNELTAPLGQGVCRIIWPTLPQPVVADETTTLPQPVVADETTTLPQPVVADETTTLPQPIVADEPAAARTELVFIAESAPIRAPPPLQQRGPHGPIGVATPCMRDDQPPNLTGYEPTSHLIAIGSIGTRLLIEVSENHNRYLEEGTNVRWCHFFKHCRDILERRNNTQQ